VPIPKEKKKKKICHSQHGGTKSVTYDEKKKTLTVTFLRGAQEFADKSGIVL